MDFSAIAKLFAEQCNLPKAEKYDMVLRDFDDKIEIIGYVPDPTLDMKDFEGREMLFPKRWVTLTVIPASTTL
jgi:hypothetical protein